MPDTQAALTKHGAFFEKRLRRQTTFALGDLTENGELSCVPLFSQLSGILCLLRGFLRDVAPPKVLADRTVVPGQPHELYHSYQNLLAGFQRITRAGREITGSFDLRDHLLYVCMRIDTALGDAQGFFETERCPADRDAHMSETHRLVGSAIEHVQFLCDQHEECLRDQRRAEDGGSCKRQRIGPVAPCADVIAAN